MAGELTPRYPLTILDDPTVTAVGGFTHSRHNLGVKLTGGTNNQLVARSTADDGTTGLTLTSTPTVTAIVFPLTAPGGTPANGSFWIEDDGASLTLFVKRADGSLTSLVLG